MWPNTPENEEILNGKFFVQCHVQYCAVYVMRYTKIWKSSSLWYCCCYYLLFVFGYMLKSHFQSKFQRNNLHIITAARDIINFPHVATYSQFSGSKNFECNQMALICSNLTMEIPDHAWIRLKLRKKGTSPFCLYF